MLSYSNVKAILYTCMHSKKYIVKEVSYEYTVRTTLLLRLMARYSGLMSNILNFI